MMTFHRGENHCFLLQFHIDVLSVKKVRRVVYVYCILFLFLGTDINDKLRGNLNTPALMKMLNTSEPGDLATPRMSLETPLSDQDKMMLETPLRTSLTLECDMYESDVMLDTLSDTSTWSHSAMRWTCHSKRFSEINISKPRTSLPPRIWYLISIKGYPVYILLCIIQVDLQNITILWKRSNSESETYILYRFITYWVKYLKTLFLEISCVKYW